MLSNLVWTLASSRDAVKYENAFNIYPMWKALRYGGSRRSVVKYGKQLTHHVQ